MLCQWSLCYNVEKGVIMSIQSKSLLKKALQRRTTRSFTKEEVDLDEIKDCIMIASSAPNGANKQPWYFSVIIDEQMKNEIQKKAEAVEEEFYQHKISEIWKQDLKHLHVNAKKEFLSEAGCLIVIFKQMYTLDVKGNLHPNYYVNESVGIATGMLIQCLHDLGYASVTYTPAPMRFLVDMCNRKNGEEPFLLLAIGKASSNYVYPNLIKKTFEEIAEIK